MKLLESWFSRSKVKADKADQSLTYRLMLVKTDNGLRALSVYPRGVQAPAKAFFPCEFNDSGTYFLAKWPESQAKAAQGLVWNIKKNRTVAFLSPREARDLLAELEDLSTGTKRLLYADHYPGRTQKDAFKQTTHTLAFLHKFRPRGEKESRPELAALCAKISYGLLVLDLPLHLWIH